MKQQQKKERDKEEQIETEKANDGKGAWDNIMWEEMDCMEIKEKKKKNSIGWLCQAKNQFGMSMKQLL